MAVFDARSKVVFGESMTAAGFQIQFKGPRHFYSMLFALALVCACLTFGLKRIRHFARMKPSGEALIGVVQPHLSQRRTGGREKTLEAINTCAELSGRLLNSEVKPLEVTEKTANFLSASKRSQILQNGSLLQFNGKVL